MSRVIKISKEITADGLNESDGLLYEVQHTSSLNRAAFYICDGTIPTPTEMNSLQPAQLQSNGILMWSWTSGKVGFPTIVDNVVTLDLRALSFRTASKTATATWWVLFNYYSTSVHQAMFGSVGAIGSGADLELGTSSFVTSRTYMLDTSFDITYPTEFTYGV